MSRLTKRNADGVVTLAKGCHDGCEYLTCSMEEGYSCEHQCEADIVCKLADYEDKQEQGLLIELKVPLGTEIWYLSYEEDYEQSWWDIDYGIYSLSWIHYHENKEFFLTRSEAEEALAKMGGANE